MNSWSQLVGSAASFHIKKYLFDILKDRYRSNEAFIDRITSNLSTPTDIEGLGRFVSNIYELGYLRSVDDHKDALEKMGLKATIKPKLTEEIIDDSRIFPKS